MPKGAKCEFGCTCGKHHGTRFNDPDSLKTCKTCGEAKPLAQFGISKQPTATKNASYRSICKSCQAAAVNAWYARPGNKERAVARGRRAFLRRKYGISTEEYDDLLARQDGGCAICNSRDHALDYRLAVDHDHHTGQVRGLLCHRCNLGIGQFQDNIDLLRKAIKYLEEGE